MIKSLVGNCVSGLAVGSLGALQSSRQYVNVLVFGSSNIGASANSDVDAFPDQYSNFDSNRFFKLSPDTSALVPFTTPVNQTGSAGDAVWTLTNEDMGYGVAESVLKALGDSFPTKKIAIVSACKSGITVATTSATSWLASRNAGNPFDMTTRYGQVISKAQALMDETGESIDLIYFPDAGADAAINNAGVPAAVETGYLNGITNIKADLNIPDAVIAIPNLGATPENVASYPKWIDTRTELRGTTWPDDAHLIDSEPDLDIDLSNGVQFEFPLSVGESGIWTLGEYILGATSGVRAKVAGYNLGSNIVTTDCKAAFTAGEVVTGQTSGVTATLSSPLAPVTVHYNTLALNRLGSKAASLLTTANTTAFTVALIGDSITAQNDSANDKEFTSQGYMTWVNALTGQRYAYQPSHNLGVSGQAIAATLSGITGLAALSPVPTKVFWLPFANDITGARTYADLIADFDDIVDYVTGTLGAKLTIITTLPRTQDAGVALTTAQLTLLLDLNDYIRAVRNSNVVVVDAYHAMATTGTNSPNPTLFDDESGKLLHPAPTGAYEIAKQIKIVLDPVYGSNAIPDMSVSDLSMNSDMSGTTGTENSALASATIADGWNLYSYTGMTGTANKDGSDKQSINVSYTNSRTFDLWELQATDITSGFVVGEKYYMEAEIDIVAMSNVRMGVCVEPTLTVSGSYKVMSPYDINSWPTDYTGVLHLRTPVFTIQSGDVNIDPIIWAQMNSIGVTSNTNLIIKQCQFKRV